MARVLLFLGLLFVASSALGEEITFESDSLLLERVDGTRHEFQVEVARTPPQQARGLMFRRTLSPDAGMLFLYRAPQVVSMWMRNTLLPLDMLFIDDKGRIVRIAERTVPLSTTVISSREPVVAVLELNGGTVDRLGLAVGDRLLHPAFDRP